MSFNEANSRGDVIKTDIKNFKQGDVLWVHADGQAVPLKGVKAVPNVYRDSDGNYHLISLSLIPDKENKNES